MDFVKRNLKRIAIDTAGYLLIIAAILTGWLPGPGGIPLAIAGLGLLSINNEWARKLRDYLLNKGGKIVQAAFPDNPLVQWLYDAVVILLWVLVAVLAWEHAAIWQLSAAIGFFFVGLAIALLNRDRLHRLKARRTNKA